MTLLPDSKGAGLAVAGMPRGAPGAASGRPLRRRQEVVKRAEDLLLAVPLLVLLAPLMLLLALAIRLESPGPALFRQARFGRGNREFRMWKFRTMHLDRGDPSGARRTVRGDARVTRLGRWLRRLSLDELPQLLNVVRGEMSMVGPRPHAVAMRVGGRLYGEAVEGYAARHRVRPGITGLAQVSGLRGEVDGMEHARRRVELDLRYIDAWTLGLDLRIIARTARRMFADDQAY